MKTLRITAFCLASLILFTSTIAISANPQTLPVLVIHRFGTDRTTSSTHETYGRSGISFDYIPGGRTYYTLDGSEPSIASTQFTETFFILEDTRVRAISYSADFSQSKSADVQITVLPAFLLGNLSRTRVNVTDPNTGQPINSRYVKPGQLIRREAIEENGWVFQRWKGGVPSTDRVQTYQVTSAHEFAAVMMRTAPLAVDLVGGKTQVWPAPPYFSDGDRVVFSAEPKPGFAFVGWQNSAEPNSSYLAYPTEPVLVPLFAPLPATHRSLTIHYEGLGQVEGGQSYALAGSQFNLTAIPEPGWIFTGWSGDLSGSDAKASLTLNSDKKIVAHFQKIVRYQTATYPAEFVESSPAVGLDGTAYVNDGWAVRAYNQEGLMVWRVEYGSNYSDGQVAPVVGPDGTIYVAGEHRLLAIRPNGEIRWAVKHPGLGRDVWLALSQFGLYASTPTSLRRYNLDGVLLAEQPGVGYQVAVDTEGNVRSFGSHGRFVGHTPALTEQFSAFGLRGLSPFLSLMAIDLNDVCSFWNNGGASSSSYVTISPTGAYKSRNAVGVPSAFGVDQILGNLNRERLAAYDPTNFRMLWNTVLPNPVYFTAHSAAAEDGSYFSAVRDTQNGRNYLWRISHDGPVIWSTPLPGQVLGYPILTDTGILAVIAGSRLCTYPVGVKPAVSGTPMGRFNWRNTAQAYTGSLQNLELNKLSLHPVAANWELRFVPADGSRLLLQSSNDLETWRDVRAFSGPLTETILDTAAPATFFRVVPETP